MRSRAAPYSLSYAEKAAGVPKRLANVPDRRSLLSPKMCKRVAGVSHSFASEKETMEKLSLSLYAKCRITLC